MFLFKNNTSNAFSSLQLFVLSLVVSAVLLFVYSKNSLIYPMNDYIDVNIFFSVTDSLFHGNVLYKDIFEHKGPFLYLVYAFIHVLGNSYFTLYLFECIANALFIYFGTKTILLYNENANKSRTFLYTLCLEFCLCTSTTFMFGGVPEELYLWMSSYGLFVTLRCLKQNQYYSSKELVVIGSLCGMIFWTKYAMLGFYAGLVLYVIGWNFSQKKFARLGKTIALYLSGFAICTMPTVIYCLLTHSFGDMVNVYFVGNIWGNHITPNASAHFYALMHIIYKDIAVVLLIIFGTLFTLKKEQISIKSLFLITFVPVFLASCCLKVFFAYYPLPMLIFLPIGIAACQKMKIRREFKFRIAVLMVMLYLFASLEFSMYDLVIGDHLNPLWLKAHIRVLAKAAIPLILLYFAITGIQKFKRENQHAIGCACMLVLCTLAGLGIRDPDYFSDSPLPQIRFGETIKQIEHANILVYGSYDYGFFKSSKTYPQLKHFNKVNLVADETDSEQNRYIKNEIVDFIISQRDISNDLHGTTYNLLDTSDPYHYNGYVITFYLYGKSEPISHVTKLTTRAIGG